MQHFQKVHKEPSRFYSLVKDMEELSKTENETNYKDILEFLVTFSSFFFFFSESLY